MITDKIQFPSPYGVTVIKSSRLDDDDIKAVAFPSPYGVTVIKSDIDLQGFKTVAECFRPLTG